MISRRSGAASSDRGAVAILTAVLIPVLILLTALAVDLGRWYVEAARVQKAADAAALGGVTYMPNNYSSAQTTAGDVSADNGYGDSGTSACTAASLASGTKCVSTFKTGVVSELGVTVSSTITNVFGSVFGNPTTTIARTAVADYQGPAIMGSPCNTFGNEPNAGGGSASDPAGTTIPSDTTQNGYATCQNRTPNFWATIEGPETDKVQGDRYSTRDCSNSTDGCSSSSNPTNSEYDPTGYFFAVRVAAPAVNQQVTVQLFDPAFVLQGTTCSSLPSNSTATVTNRTRSSNTATLTTSSAHGLAVGDGVQVSGVGSGFDGSFTVTAIPSSTRFSYANSGSNVSSTSSSGSTATIYNGMNPWVPSDASTRYARSGTSGFCTGDYNPGGGGTPNAMVTSFVLRNKTLSQNPLQAAVIPGCVKQFGSVTSGPTAASLNSSSSGTTYKGQLAALLHQWYTLCTFTPTEAGDYYLQVRTSASTSGATAESGFSPNGTTLIYNNGPNAYADSATQTTGEGDNSFGIRAFVGFGTSQPDSLNSSVSVAGYQRMPIFQNVSSTSNFNLLQVKPDAAGKQFYFDLFDLGDGAGGTITVLPPDDSGLAATDLTGCTYKKTLASTTYVAANSGGKCAFTFNTTDTDGRVLSMIVPIPPGYNCTASSAGGCWFKIQIARSGSPTDITTWNAAIGGNALRLVQ
jgi:Flp pilus assembly protein TadG